MNKSKIDRLLFESVSTLSGEKRWNCLVHSNDFLRTKNILLHNHIEIVDEYLFIKSFHVLLTKRQIEYLSSISQVRFISSIAQVSALMHVSKKVLGVEDCMLSGLGQGVAFIDTGICSHADFLLGRNRLCFFKDFVNEKKHCYDDNGHGTFVAGVCSGSGALSAGRLCGVAPRSNIFALKALDKNGEASADKILSAMEWVYDNHNKQKISVVCMSFGSEPLGSNDPIMHGAESLWRDGVVVVAAAGNSGPQFQTIKSPGVSRSIITVGGFDDNRQGDQFDKHLFEIAPFSSRGPAFKSFKPDLVAPAVDISSCGVSKTYQTLSGTSVATPMIAGVCLLMKEKNNQLLPQEIKRWLLSSCRPICFNKNLEGYGYPDFSKIILR